MTSAKRSKAPDRLPAESGVAVYSKLQVVRKVRPSRSSVRQIVPEEPISKALVGVEDLCFQTLGLRAVSDVGSLQPNAGVDNLIAVGPEQVIANEENTVVSEGGFVTTRRTIPGAYIVNASMLIGSGDAKIEPLSAAAGHKAKQNYNHSILNNRSDLSCARGAAHTRMNIRDASLVDARETVHTSLFGAGVDLDRSEITDAWAHSAKSGVAQ